MDNPPVDRADVKAEAHKRRNLADPVRPSSQTPATTSQTNPLPTTGDSRYCWLDGALALWEGEFNEVTHRARHTAFLQPTAPAT